MSFDPEKATTAVQKLLQNSVDICQERGNIDLTPCHIAYTLFTKDTAAFTSRVVSKCGITTHGISTALTNELNKLPRQSPAPNPSFNHGCMNVLRAADKYRAAEKSSHIALDHVLLGLYEDDRVSTILQGQGIPKSKAETVIREMKGSKPSNSSTSEDTYDALSKYGVNLTELAANHKLDPVIGRTNELHKVSQILLRRTKNNPILVGPAGSGKTAIVEALAQKIIAGDVPNSLRNRTIISLDLGALIAGASHRGEFEERLKSVVDAAKESDGGIILFIDEAHMLLGMGSTGGAMDASNLIKPELARGLLKVILATTTEEYRKYIEKDSAFARRLQPVYVESPTVDETISILRGVKEKYELHHGVNIKDAALVAAAQLADRYLPHRQMPDSALDLLDQSCANIRIQLDTQPTIIDELERKLLRLQVEHTALTNEKDDNNNERIDLLEKQISTLEQQIEPLKERYSRERGKVTELMALKEKYDNIIGKLERAEREKNVALVADLKYYVLPEIKAKIKETEIAMEEEKKTNIQAEQDKMVSEVVTADEIAKVVSSWTGIPVDKLTQSDRSKLLSLPKQLNDRVIGQSHAVKAISDSIMTSRANLAQRNKPIGFLFLGPSGVGKTELSKALTGLLFNSEKDMIRIDCSEYASRHDVSRLIGAPPGYVGFEDAGMLTNAVSNKPYSVVLFDEVEKAHPDIFNILLQVLDDGRLTDNRGKVVDFSNTIVILTSNLGSEHLLAYANERKHQDVVEFKNTDQDWIRAKAKVMEACRKFFRIEFLNRLDGLIVFHPLSTSNMASVCKLHMKNVVELLQKQQHITIDYTEQLIQRIAKEAFDPAYGARPVKRFLQQKIVTSLSKLIIKGALNPGQHVRVDTSSDFKQTKESSDLGFVEEIDEDVIHRDGYDEEIDMYRINDHTWEKDGITFSISGTIARKRTSSDQLSTPRASERTPSSSQQRHANQRHGGDSSEDDFLDVGMMD